MKAWWDKLRKAFADLAPRERALVSAVGALVVVIVAWFGVIVPTMDAAARMSGGVEAAERELAVTRRLHGQYKEVASRLASVEQRIGTGTGGSLRTKLETLAAQASIKVDSMEPQTAPSNERYKETKVEVTLKQVDLPRTVRYLHEIESAEELLSVKSLRMRTRPDKSGLLDVSFTVSSFESL